MPFDYIVRVKTSCEGGAGTDADVYVNLIGTQGTSGEYSLDHEGYNDFEKCDDDTYKITTNEYLGTIEQIHLRVNDRRTNDNPAWNLDHIEVNHSSSGQTYNWIFPVHRWIGNPERNPNVSPDIAASMINNISIGYDGLIW